VPRFRGALVASGVLQSAQADAIKAQVDAEMKEAVTAALASPMPALESALQNVYA
jgi:TPP-dependent pyruvate/acetoin dehydrogenase alpha subunit